MPQADRDMLELAMDAFDRMGGRGSLKPHYSMIERLCRERGIDCPSEEHVRITIYNYTPGRKSYLNRGAFFEIAGRGEYRVTRPTLDQL